MVFATVQVIAVLSCTIFAGAAIYINLVEHPARMDCGTKIAATVWAPSYHRATMMQAPLAIVSFLAGTTVWILGGSVTWFVGALLIGLVVPVTFLIIMPTNEQLLIPSRNLESNETHALLNRWAKFHGIRSILSLIASIIYVTLLVVA